jgi:hypothetical protein
MIVLARFERSGGGPSDSSDVKAIVLVMLVLPENRGEDLVQPACRVEERGGAREALPSRGAYSVAEDGPSGPVSRQGVDDLRFRRIARTSRTSLHNNPTTPAG